MNAKCEPVCFCCGTAGKDGMPIAGRFLCYECESKLLALTPDSAEYERMLACCRSLWAVFKN